MRLTNVIVAIWRETKGFLLVLAIVACVYMYLYSPRANRPAPAPTNAPPALTNVDTNLPNFWPGKPPPPVTGIKVTEVSTNRATNTTK
jgi:hypothetical protein